MTTYGENEGQGKYWNEKPGQSWVAHDASMNERLSNISEILFEGLDAANCKNGLDIGCGAGSTTRRLHKLLGAQSKVTGLDISEQLLNLARSAERNELIEYVQADAQSFSFDEQGTDIAISRFGVMFFENPVKAFENIRSAIKQGGQFRFVCWAPLEVNEFFYAPLNAVMDITGVSLAAPGKEPGPLAFSDYDYLSSVLKNSGFSSVKIDVVETVIRTEDSAEQNASLLMEIGMGFRAIKEAQPVPEMLKNIKNAFVQDGLLRQKDGVITYGATIYRVTAQA
ncbi:MAG: ubiquinone/menaquinone biosynthesis protein [Legionellales bacterium]|nr:ubiquinone/menaquinone biosynthesis protein [Legionellales bacterium]